MTQIPFHWAHRPGVNVSLLQSESALVQYHFASDRQKPYCHPVCTPGRVPLTCFEPWDHVWHRGLWFAWKYLNGLNYWEEEAGKGAEGHMVMTDHEQVSLSQEKAVVETHLEYRPAASQQAMLTEDRTVVLYMPRADGILLIDWRASFTALEEDVKIDCTPINAQTPWGGYAGLSWRAARSLGNFRALNSEGKRDQEVEHQRACWVDLSGSSDGGWNVEAGIAMFDHPSNPRFPTHWRCILDPGFGYLNPSLVLAEPYTVLAGESLTLQYRVLIHQGRGDPEFLQEEYRRFSATPAR